MTCCVRTAQNKFTRFASIADARRADAPRRGRPCSPDCRGRHLLAWCSVGSVHVARSPFDPSPVPASLAGAIAQAYPYRRRNGYPKGPEKMTRKETAMTEQPDDEQARQIIAAERRAGRLLARLGPRGRPPR
jgi:hypothetical protein